MISEATLRLIAGLYITKDLGTPPLKGVDEPIRAYAVVQSTGVRSRLETNRDRLTPLVGREQELDRLLGQWSTVLEGAGQAALISGEAGVGKSRLLQAFHERLASEAHSWFECRSTPYSQGSAFYPLIELLERSLGFKEGDNVEAKLRRLERGIERGGLHGPDVVPLIALLLQLSLPDRYPPQQASPALQRKKTMEALVTWLLAIADRQQLVMLVEDLHWCDASTLEVLGLILEKSDLRPLLTILTFRPEFAAPWSGHPHVSRLDLERLTSEEAEKLVGAATSGASLPEEVTARIVGRADGVPLFLEELTKMVLDSDLLEQRDDRYILTSDLTDLAIPTTLQDSLIARLDKLADGKPVAQRAAALGREFSFELLEAVSPYEASVLQTGLTALVDAGLVYE